MKWWQILLIVIVSLILLFILSIIFYKQFFKRFWDIVLSGLAIVVLSPFFLILSLLGLIFMKGNPFFVQERPGKNEKIFKLIKFRSMTNLKYNDVLLEDKARITKYGRFIRSTSLDELPELLVIFAGKMSFVGPRPLVVEYLPYYNEIEKHRHDIRPGLTGLAQVNGRNTLQWEDRFKLDLDYVNNVSLLMDLKIMLKTIVKVFKKENIVVSGEGKIIDFDKYRIQQNEKDGNF